MAFILSMSSFQLGAAVAYQKGMHTTEFNGKCSDNRPKNKDVHMTAIENAKKAAWNNYTAKFSAEKTEKYMVNSDAFTSNLDKFISADLSFNSDSCLLACKPVIPAASSSNILLSSGLELINL